MSQATVLQLVMVDETGDSYYRMRWPARDLAVQRPDWRIINLNANAAQRFELAAQADLLVLYQCMDLDLLPVIADRKRRGLKTLAEYNDNFYAPPEWSPHAREWSSPLLWQTYETLLNACDALMVTGPGLAELFAGVTDKPIHIIENQLPEELSNYQPKQSNNGILIGWAGSLGHMADILYITPLLAEILSEHPNTHLHLMGNESIPDLINIPQDRFTFRNWGSMQDYFDFWTPLHIGMAPLLATPYNSARSDVKAIEMSSKSVLPILQNAQPYQKFLSETGLANFNTLAELKTLLKKYIMEPALISHDCRRAYDFVRERRIGVKCTERAELYQALLPPSCNQQFAWPVPSGFQQLELPAQKEARSVGILQHVQELWKGAKRPEALAAIETALRENPLHPDLRMLQARMFCSLSHPYAAQALLLGRKDFPHDLRYLLLQIKRTPELNDRKLLWQELIEACRASTQKFNFFESEIIANVIAEKEHAQLFEAVLAALLKISPNCAPLLFQLASLYEKSGRFELARDYFQRLREMKNSFEQNRDFLQGISQTYLSAWFEALHARTHN